MEQHNIDSRFKEGLKNLDRQPSADAWARLQSQMNAPQMLEEPETIAPEEKKEERRILMWWHYAAAAVVLLFISVGILRNGSNFGDKTEMPVAVNQPKETPASTEKASEIKEPVSVSEVIPETAIAKTESPEIIQEIGSKTKVKTTLTNDPETQIAQIAKKLKTEKVTDKTTDYEQPKPEQAIQKQEEVLIASAQPNQDIKTKTSETKPALLAGMTIEVIVKKDNSENALAMAEPATTDEKDSKLVNIFKQAKNLKNGERVDLQAIGLTSDSKLALGTRNIQQKFSKVLDI